MLLMAFSRKSFKGQKLEKVCARHVSHLRYIITVSHQRKPFQIFLCNPFEML